MVAGQSFKQSGQRKPCRGVQSKLCKFLHVKKKKRKITISYSNLIVFTWYPSFKVIFPQKFDAERANAVDFHFLWVSCVSLEDLEYSYILGALGSHNNIFESGALNYFAKKQLSHMKGHKE